MENIIRKFFGILVLLNDLNELFDLDRFFLDFAQFLLKLIDLFLALALFCIVLLHELPVLPFGNHLGSIILIEAARQNAKLVEPLL